MPLDATTPERPLAIEYRTTESLIPYARNARTHSEAQVAQIAASIREFGWTNPVLIDARGSLIAGHGRLAAARKLGMTEVPVIVLDGLSEIQQRALVLADNKLALNAGWDNELLKVELTELQASGFLLEVTGFEPLEVASLLHVEPPPPAGEDRIEAPPAQPVTVPGDIWVMGDHRLVCGSCTDAGAWDALQVGPDAVCFTSPPYGVGKTSLRNSKKTAAKGLYANHADDIGEWPQLMQDWTALALAHCVQSIINVQMLANNKRALVAWLATFGEHLAECAIWDKGYGPPAMARNVLTSAFEFLFILGEPGSTRSLKYADFHGDQNNVVRVGMQKDHTYSEIHKATMPLALAEWAVTVAARRAKTIVEPFCGTGTTLIAAEAAGKRCCAIEMDAGYCDVIVKRWQGLTGKQAVHGETGAAFPA